MNVDNRGVHFADQEKGSWIYIPLIAYQGLVRGSPAH